MFTNRTFTVVITAFVVTAVVGMPVYVGSVGTSAAAAETESPSRIPVDGAIVDARHHLVAQQRNGHWGSNITSGTDGVVDVRLSFYYALLLERHDTNERSKRAAIEWALSKRSPDGGWNDTVANYAALLLFEQANVTGYDDVAADIRAENQRANLSLVGDTTGNAGNFVSTFRLRLLYALMSDRYTARELFPDSDPGGFVTLAELTPAFQDGIRPNESFVAPFASEAVMTQMVLGLAVEKQSGWTGGGDNMLTDGGWEPNDNRTRAMEQVGELLVSRRDARGVWMTTWDNVFAMFALTEVGYEASDPEMRRALEYIESKRQAPSGRIMSIKIPVWDTAWTVYSLRKSGVSPDNESLEAATQWLYEARTAPPSQKETELPLDRMPVPLRSHHGDGWGWKPHMTSDWDDTSVALVALNSTGKPDRADIAFLFAVQNSDGGWAAFASDFEPLNDLEQSIIESQGGEEFYQLLFTSHSSPDVTGHALMALGQRGYTVENNESVQNAVEYLVKSRDDDGLWRGDWGKGYTYGTSRALLGMRAAGTDMDRREVRVAVSEVLERQNDDGGWGVREGEPSRPTYTAWALQALLAAGVSPNHQAVRRAVQYLLDTQRADGSWNTGRVMQNVGGFEYRLPVFSHASILLALTMYQEAPDRPPEEYNYPLKDVPTLPVALAVVLAAAIAVAFAVRRR